MFESIMNFFKKIGNKDKIEEKSKDTAKERLHLVLMQDRANVSADFLDMMRQEIIEVIKKYIDVDEKDIDVRLTNKTNEDGTIGAPALYANIPITGIKENMKKEKETKDTVSDDVKEKEHEEQREEDNNEKEEKQPQKQTDFDPHRPGQTHGTAYRNHTGDQGGNDTHHDNKHTHKKISPPRHHRPA